MWRATFGHPWLGIIEQIPRNYRNSVVGVNHWVDNCTKIVCGRSSSKDKSFSLCHKQCYTGMSGWTQIRNQPVVEK